MSSGEDNALLESQGGSAMSPRLSIVEVVRSVGPERWFSFICVQIPCLVFAATYSAVGVYCYHTGDLVYRGGIEAHNVAPDDKALAACNKFRMLMMSTAGFALFVSLASTTIFTKACDDAKVVQFVKSTFPTKFVDWIGKNKGEPPGLNWYLWMIKDLDPVYTDGDCSKDCPCNLKLTRRIVDFFLDEREPSRCWCCVKWLVRIPCHIVPCFLIFHPVWWWVRINMYPNKDFSIGDMGPEPAHLGATSMAMTLVFIVAAIWQHWFFMFDDVYVSRFAALWMIQTIDKAIQKLQDVGTSECCINWNEQLGVVVQMKRDLEKFWSSFEICLPWFTLGMVGVVLVVLGGITGLNTGFVSGSAVGQMAREYVLIGCAIVLTVLFTLSTIAALFCRHSMSTDSVASKAEQFLMLYLQKLAEDTMGQPPRTPSRPSASKTFPTAAPPRQDPPRLSEQEEVAGLKAAAQRERKREDYVQSMRRFIEFVTKDQIGARVLGGVLITRGLASLTLKTMASGIGILIIVNKGVLEYMKDNLDMKTSAANSTNVCEVDMWLSETWTHQEKAECCQVNDLFCGKPPQDRQWLEDLVDDLDKVDDKGKEFKSGKVPEALKKALDAAAGYKKKLDQKDAKAEAAEGGTQADEVQRHLRVHM